MRRVPRPWPRANARCRGVDVWLRAFAARGGYDPAHADALPWLYGIARNVLREHWRASLQAAQAPAPDVVDPWDEVKFDSDARARALAAAVRALPASVREVLLLVAWEQLTRLRRPACWASRRVPRAGREQRCAWLLGRRTHAGRTRTT